MPIRRRLEPLVVARGFVIRVTAVLNCSDQEEPQQTSRALAAARKVRQKLIDKMSRGVRKVAPGRLYSVCRRAVPENSHAELPPAQLRVNIMLTKPYVREFTQQGAPQSGNTDTT